MRASRYGKVGIGGTHFGSLKGEEDESLKALESVGYPWHFILKRMLEKGLRAMIMILEMMAREMNLFSLENLWILE